MFSDQCDNAGFALAIGLVTCPIRICEDVDQACLLLTTVFLKPPSVRLQLPRSSSQTIPMSYCRFQTCQVPTDSHKTVNVEDLHSDSVISPHDLRLRLLTWCAHALDLLSRRAPNFPAKARRVWGLVRKKRLPSSSTVNSMGRFRTVQCLSSFSENPTQKISFTNFSFPSKQDVVTVSPTNRGFRAVHVDTWTAQTSLVPNCNLLVRRVVSHKSRISRLECSKKLSNHAGCCVLLRQSLFTDSWWTAIQHEQLDAQFPRHVVVYRSEGRT